jgi:multidrug resistance efflux pump
MLLGFVIIFADIFVSWLVFVRLKWLKFTKIWAVLLAISYIHLYLIFFVGLRFMTPYSTEANMIQQTIQITPRLPEPTLVTDVLVQANTHVKKGRLYFKWINALIRKSLIRL